MSFTLHLLPTQRLALLCFSGHVSGAEMVVAGLDTLRHPDWHSGFAEVWDVRKASVIDLDVASLRQMAHFEHVYRDELGTGPGIVLTRRSYGVTFLRVFQHLLPAARRRYHVCVAEDEVLHLLDLAAWPLPAAAPTPR